MNINTTVNNERSSWLFNSYACGNCEYRTRDINGFCACHANFIPTDFPNEYGRADDGTPAYTISDGDIDGDKFIMCASACRARGEMCDDGDESTYYVDYVYNASTGDYNTRSYAWENLYYCDECGDWFESYDFNHNCGVCNTCAESRGVIGDWHAHKGEFVHIGDYRDRKTIGFELEIDDGDGDNSGHARLIDNAFPNRFVFENDCSLNYGYEIISQPHTLPELTALDLEKLTRMCREHDYTSHDAGTCGFHVHFAAEWFGDDRQTQVRTLARVLRWYESYFDELVILSRRGDSYSNYADKNSRAQSWDYHDVDIDDNAELVEHCICSTRYVAVNCCNFNRYGIVEFRLARGSLKASTLRTWIDLHVAIIRACCEHDAPTLDTVLTYCENAETADAVRAKLD